MTLLKSRYYSRLKEFTATFRSRTRSSSRHTFTFFKERFALPALVILAVVAIVVCLWGFIEYRDSVVNFWDSLRIEENGRESASTTIRNVGLVIAGLVALGFAVWRSVVAQKQANAAHRQSEVAQQGLLNERYQKGSEMLGSDVLAVRMGGIYALQRLAEEHPEQYYLQIMDLLAAFVRYPTRDKSIEAEEDVQEKANDQKVILREDVKPIVDMIRNRSEILIALEKRNKFTLNLHHANLPRANLSNANLADAGIWDANLFEAFLDDVDLSATYLMRTNLSRAYLWNANLADAGLWSVNLSGAELWSANLSGAILEGANLSGSELFNPDPRSRSPMPVIGLTQAQLDEARADPDNPPKLDGVLDANTGKQLVWRGRPLEDE